MTAKQILIKRHIYIRSQLVLSSFFDSLHYWACAKARKVLNYMQEMSFGTTLLWRHCHTGQNANVWCSEFDLGFHLRAGKYVYFLNTRYNRVQKQKCLNVKTCVVVCVVASLFVIVLTWFWNVMKYKGLFCKINLFMRLSISQIKCKWFQQFFHCAFLHDELVLCVKFKEGNMYAQTNS